MLKFIKSFFKKPEPVVTAQPIAEYKVETPLVQLGPEPTLTPAGTEASVAAPVVVTPTTVEVVNAAEGSATQPKPAKAPKVAKPKAEKVAKVVAEKKPRAPRKPKASKAE